MSNAFLITLALSLALGAQSIAATDATLYVAPTGNDSWSGKLSEPNAARNDGPLATLEHARLAVRDLKKNGPVTVLIRGGVYYLADTLTFEPEDSGSSQSPVTYAAYPGEKPVLSGGRLLPASQWTVDSQGRWHMQLPDVREGKWSFASIYTNGQRRFRPRLPRQGAYYIADSIPLDGPNAKPSGFEFVPGEIRSDWANLSDVEVLTIHLWDMSRMRIKSVDAASNIVRFTGETWADADFSSFRSSYPFFVDNVREALDRPGEWYLDRPTGELTYIPARGESPTTTEVVAPGLDRIIRLKGDPANSRLVEHINFKGLTFDHSNWVAPAQGHEFPQSDANLPGAVFADGASDCRFDQCRVEHTGAYAIELGAGCKRNVIEDCELTDLGAGGIKIGFGAPMEPQSETTSHNLVRNNLIAHGGRIQPAGTGILIGNSHHNRVSNNDIYDLYYMGISAGFNWDDNITARDNIIENNHIFGIGQGALSDMGAIYTLGDSPGTQIRHNLIHDVKSLMYGGWGIYLDAESSDLLIENNIVYRADAGGFHHNRGHANRVVNNVFALGTEQQLVRSQGMPKPSFDFEHNVIYWKDGYLLGSNWTDLNFHMDNNLYWNASGRPVEFGPFTLDEWRAKGQDQHSIVADPLFADPSAGDFRLSKDSPALKLGFKPIENGNFGRHGRLLVNPSFFPRAFPDLSEQQPVRQGFEDVAVGKKWPGVATNEEDSSSIIRVTDELAVSGRHSLKFIDDGKQKQSYNPHLVLGYKCVDGVVRGKFALLMKPGATFAHEWRDTTAEAKPGPSIAIDSSGNLTARGVKLQTVPTGKWIWIEIICGVGPKSTGLYDLSVKVDGEKRANVYHDLKRDPMFHKLLWVGFLAEGTGPGTFYIDEVSFTSK